MEDKREIVLRADKEWEQIVYAELLIPEVPNVYGDYWTRESIKAAAYLFAKTGYGIDLEHDNVDITGDVYVAESFIVRAGDPDFIEGSWVIGMKIENAELWQQVLDGEINGYSYEALVRFVEATLQLTDDFVRTGTTEPDVNDGHVHTFMVIVGEDNRPVEGGTDEVDGHYHEISVSTVTGEAIPGIGGHVHRYNLVQGKDGK